MYINKTQQYLSKLCNHHKPLADSGRRKWEGTAAPVRFRYAYVYNVLAVTHSTILDLPLRTRGSVCHAILASRYYLSVLGEEGLMGFCYFSFGVLNILVQIYKAKTVISYSKK